MMRVLSTPRYTQTNLPPHICDHFCTHYQALYVPQRLIFTNELVRFWFRPVPYRPVPYRPVDLVVVKPPFSNKFTLSLTLQLH